MFTDQQVLNTERLELIYNLHSVCEALMYDSVDAAAALFAERVKEIAAQPGGISTEESVIMLNSLNRGLYDFFQFYLHASFTVCCHNNRVSASSFALKTYEEIINAGIGILRAYRKTYVSAQSECDHLERARNHIREHISDKITLNSVSSAINISPSYLSRIFSAVAGQTFCDYIRDERIALACKLLRASNLSIDEVSERCGFSTPNYFSTVFRKCMGLAPVAYRTDLRRNKRSVKATRGESLENDGENP